MNITLNRQKSNELYTQGTLVINHEPQTQTVECTEVMLPAGLYSLRLVTIHAHRRDLIVFDFATGQTTGWRLSETARSHIGCRKEHSIAMGQELIPGALYKAQADLERLVKRLEKCQRRGEPILLVIDESHCTPSIACSHWQKPETDYGVGVTRN